MPGGGPEGIRVITLPPHLDMTNADQVRDDLIQALDGRGALAADMTATLYCTLEGLQALLAAHVAAAAAGAQLRIAAVSPQVRRRLQLTGADQVLHLYPSLDAALAAG
jgi:anti-sigma B factor antagonist